MMNMRGAKSIMKKTSNMIYKVLVFGVIVLFIGAAVTPSISGYHKKTVVLSVKEAPAVFPLGEYDYVNAYWKFDESSGDIAYDSSVHGYDGTINGSTWTTGKLNSGLEFDGVDDYVYMDQYAKNYLGFNKTDDLIFSFYFKSSSTEKGIIYSMCRGGDQGYNPGFHIALCSNGTIEVQVWRLSCGIKMWSNDTYNDGSWHFVEVYYNGISAKPIVYIFVDRNLDNSFEKYICDFYSDNFQCAQIGRNSAELIDYFDGIIDEFKIFKYPGGNEQEPPFIDGPLYGDPAEELEYTFTTYDPEGDDDLYILIDWDDGTKEDWRGPYDSGEIFTVSHKWIEEDAYYIRARCKDFWHESSWSDGYPVYIGNQPPSPPAVSGPKYGDPDLEYTYTFRSKDVENNDIRYIIEWDDGTKTETDYYPSDQKVELQKTWDEKGDYKITAQAIDEQGAGGLKSEYNIRIGDHPPGKPNIDGPVSGKANVEIDFEFTAIDPENDQVWFDIDWDDGNVITDVGPYNSGEKLTKSHKWTMQGTYIVKARAKDNYDFYGEWESYQIKIPRVRAFNFNLFEMLLERLPILEKLLGWIR